MKYLIFIILLEAICIACLVYAFFKLTIKVSKHEGSIMIFKTQIKDLREIINDREHYQ